MTMKKANSLIKSIAMTLAALALAGCAGTAEPAQIPEEAPPAVTAVQELKILAIKKAALPTQGEPAEEETEPASEAPQEQDEGAPSDSDTELPAEGEPEQAADTAPTDGQTAAESPAPEQTPDPIPEPVAQPEQTAEPEPAPAPEPEPAPAPVPAPAYGAIPFSVAAGTDKWWVIDSSDSAYWAMLDQINAVRAAGGLPALAMDGNLSAIASSRCESFVAGGPFDHSGMVTASEICASGPLGSASAACAAWVASPGHYAQIMRTDLTSMGVGCWFCSIEGNNFTYWTVTFG